VVSIEVKIKLEFWTILLFPEVQKLWFKVGVQDEDE